MKHKSPIIFITMVMLQCYLPLHASTNTKDKIKKIEAIHVEAVQKHGKLCWKCQENARALLCHRGTSVCFDLSDINHKFYKKVDELVLCAEDLTDLEKLNYLHGDPNFKRRKAIIITIGYQ